MIAMKKKKHAHASLYFVDEEVELDESFERDEESIPRLSDEQLESLERKGVYTPGPETKTNRRTIQPTKASSDTSIGEKGEPVSVASGNIVAPRLREDRSHFNRAVQSRIDEDEFGFNFDERGFDFWSAGVRIGMVAAVFALCVWLAGLWRNSDPVRDSELPKLSAASLVNSKSIGAPMGLSASDPSSDFRITTKQISDIEVGMRVPAHNPDRTDAERASASTNVDPKTWRVFELELEKENGAGKLELKLLRPVSWLVDEVAKTDALLIESLIAESESSVPELSDEATQFLSDLESQSTTDVIASMVGLASRFGNPVNATLGYFNDTWQSELQSIVEYELCRDDSIDSILAGEGVGSEVYLTMPELGAVGFAKVLSISAAPEVNAGPGEVVTGTFRHSSAQVLDLRFDASGIRNTEMAQTAPVGFSNDSQPTSRHLSSSGLTPQASSLTLGVTAAHPFWSVDREEFVPAGDLRQFERVVAIDGREFRLTSITPRDGPETVYNFEVANEHVYYVGDDGLLVHNLYLTHMHHSIPRAIQRRLAKAGNAAANSSNVIGRAGLPNRIKVSARQRQGWLGLIAEAIAGSLHPNDLAAVP